MPRPTNRHKWLVLRLYARGERVRAIALRVGLSHQEVCRLARQAGLPLRKARSRSVLEGAQKAAEGRFGGPHRP